MMKKYFLFALLFVFTMQGFLTTVSAQTQKTKKKEDVIVMAQFKGGKEALVDYLLQNTRYPAEAMKLEQTGEVVIEFVVELHALKSLRSKESLSFEKVCSLDDGCAPKPESSSPVVPSAAFLRKRDFVWTIVTPNILYAIVKLTLISNKSFNLILTYFPFFSFNFSIFSSIWFFSPS